MPKPDGDVIEIPFDVNDELREAEHSIEVVETQEVDRHDVGPSLTLKVESNIPNCWPETVTMRPSLMLVFGVYDSMMGGRYEYMPTEVESLAIVAVRSLKSLMPALVFKKMVESDSQRR